MNKRKQILKSTKLRLVLLWFMLIPFAYQSEGDFEISAEQKMRWTSKQEDNSNGYFYPLPQYKTELWRRLDELICYKPKRMKFIDK
jgi:hypothetical protein